MKKRVLIALLAMFVFGLFATVFALSGATATADKTEVSCPMHRQAAAGDNHKDSCCGMADCCQDGKCSMGGACCKDKDACPIKKTPTDDSAQLEMAKVVVVTSSDSESCCQPGADCCKVGGSCCHKKK